MVSRALGLFVRLPLSIGCFLFYPFFIGGTDDPLDLARKAAAFLISAYLFFPASISATNVPIGKGVRLLQIFFSKKLTNVNTYKFGKKNRVVRLGSLNRPTIESVESV